MEACEKDKLRELGEITSFKNWRMVYGSGSYDESWYLEDCFFDEDEENFTV